MKAQNNDFLFLLQQAVKAPSGHNTQPWRFKIKESSIEIYPNFEKALSVVDADNRELYISLGCATENLCVAATEKGYVTDVVIQNQKIIIHLHYSGNVTKDPHFDQIPFRQTNRSVYKNRGISADTIAILEQTILHPTTQIRFYERGSVEFNTIKNLVIYGNTIQMEDPAFINELKKWMRFNRKQTLKSKDGISYSVFGAPNLPLFISKPLISSFLTKEKQNQGDIKKIDSTPYLVLFTVTASTIENWINLGRDLERFLLLTTKLGIANAFMNQPCELPELVEQMQESLLLTENDIPNLLLRIGYADKMPYSQRKEIHNVII